MVIDGTEYIPIDQASELLATTATAVLMLLKRKALLGIELNGRWLVSSDSLNCFKVHGKDIKTETGCKSYCSSPGGCGCR